MKGIHSIHILRCNRESCTQVEDSVVSESGLRIKLADSKGEANFALIRTIMVDPEFLIIGLLFTSRVINDLTDILELHIQNHLAKVTLVDDCKLHEKLESLLPSARLVLGICGPDEGAMSLWHICDMEPIESSMRIATNTIAKAIKGLNQAMPIFRATGGTHGAAISDQNGNLLVVAEDVGRHNAVDRAIGAALQKGVNLSTSILVSSGRLTADLVLKAAIARLPILASISAAVTSGIELADVSGVTLIGFVRGTRMNIYTHPERIQFKKK
jgi:FdhD protein